MISSRSRRTNKLVKSTDRRHGTRSSISRSFTARRLARRV
jgi:hypothetical protein